MFNESVRPILVASGDSDLWRISLGTEFLDQEVVGNLHIRWSFRCFRFFLSAQILPRSAGSDFSRTAKISMRRNFFESLILAQDERWRRALSMQVEWSQDNGRRVSNV